LLNSVPELLVIQRYCEGPQRNVGKVIGFGAVRGLHLQVKQNS